MHTTIFILISQRLLYYRSYWLQNQPKSLHARLKIYFVLEYREIIFQNSNKSFDSEVCMQIKTTTLEINFIQANVNFLIYFSKRSLYLYF